MLQVSYPILHNFALFIVFFEEQKLFVIFIFFLLNKDFISEASYSFTLQLQSRKYREILYTPCSHTHTAATSNIPHQRGTFVTIALPTLTHHYQLFILNVVGFIHLFPNS